MSSACAVASRRRTREQASSLCESHSPLLLLCSLIQYNVTLLFCTIQYFSVHIDNNVRVQPSASTHTRHTTSTTLINQTTLINPDWSMVNLEDNCRIRILFTWSCFTIHFTIIFNTVTSFSCYIVILQNTHPPHIYTVRLLQFCYPCALQNTKSLSKNIVVYM